VGGRTMANGTYRRSMTTPGTTDPMIEVRPLKTAAPAPPRNPYRGRHCSPRQCLYPGRAERDTATAGRKDNEPPTFRAEITGGIKENSVSSAQSIRGQVSIAGPRRLDNLRVLYDNVCITFGCA